jgi:hypothetical protein
MRRLVATISLLGCASTAQISTAGSDGGPGGTTDARPDAPAVDAGPPPLASCAPERWRALPPVRVSGPDEQGVSYLQAAPADDGAWVAYRRTSNTFDEDLRIARVTDDGAPHPVTRGATDLLRPLTTMDIGRRTLVSMLVTQDALEMLVDGTDDIEPCVWARFAQGAPLARRGFHPSAAAPGTSLSRCVGLLRTSTGASFLSERIGEPGRADVVRLDGAGALRGRSSLQLANASTMRDRLRVALDGHDFLAAWVDVDAGVPQLHVQRFGEGGEARGGPSILALVTFPLGELHMARTPSGAALVWHAAIPGEGSGQYYVAAAAVRDDASFAGDLRRYRTFGVVSRGLSVASRGRDVFVTSSPRNSPNGVNPRLLILDEQLSLRRTLDLGLEGDFVGDGSAGVVATPRGLMAFGSARQSMTPAALYAVPIRCD